MVDAVFDKSSVIFEEMINQLPHDTDTDELWLKELGKKEDEFGKKEFAFLYDNDLEIEPPAHLQSKKVPQLTSGDEIGAISAGPALSAVEAAIKQKALQIKDTLSEAQVNSLIRFSPAGAEELDLILRDITYMRYIEKTFLGWTLSLLQRKEHKIPEDLLVSLPRGTRGPHTFLSQLEQLGPSIQWIDRIQRWMHPMVRKKLGIVSAEDMEKSRKLFRLDENWRAKVNKDTFEEASYEVMSEKMKERFENFRRVGIPSDPLQNDEQPTIEPKKAGSASYKRRKRRKPR